MRIEAETESILVRDHILIPINSPPNKYLLCRTSIRPSEGTARFELFKPSPPMGLSKEDGGHPLTTLLDVERPLRNDEELVLLKSTGFTVMATVSIAEANV